MSRQVTQLNTMLLIGGLAVLALFLGWNYFTQPFAAWFTAQLQKPPVVDQTLTKEIPLAAQQPNLLDNVTPEQRVTALLAVPLKIDYDVQNSKKADRKYSGLTATESAWIATHQPSVVTLFGEQISRTDVTAVLDNLRTLYANRLGPVVAVDHEGGTVQRLSGDGFTPLPSWRQLCQLPETEMVSQIASSAGELSNTGIDLIWAPVVDVAAGSQVLGSRLCSSDPEEVARRTASVIKVWESAGITPVLKHFPGIGSTKKDLHKSFDRVVVTPDQAAVYHALLTTYPELGVMTSHAGVINQFPDIPCSQSSACIQELRSTFPNALVVSDALEMKAAFYLPEVPATVSDVATASAKTATLSAAVSTQPIQPELTLSDVAVRAVRSGNQVLVFGPSVTTADLDQVIQALVQEYNRDAKFRAQVDAAWKRIQLLKTDHRKL